MLQSIFSPAEIARRRLLWLSLAILAASLLGWHLRLSHSLLAPSSLGAVIPLSSLEAEFAERTIREALRVANPVVVVYADHLSDGTPEDLSFVAALRASLGSAQGLVWVPVQWFPGRTSRFWVRYLRWAGFPFLPLSTEYVAWLDGDEVLDAPRFLQWWASPEGLPASGQRAIKLANYVYFRETRFQSMELEDSVVVCRREGLTAAQFFSDEGKEREMFFDGLGGRRMALALDGAPMVHHFSWVRSQELMLKKVSAWSHSSDDRDWKALVREEFTRPFNGKDFVNGHSYRTLPVPWLDTLGGGSQGGAKGTTP
jgi:hypothetical protein